MWITPGHLATRRRYAQVSSRSSASCTAEQVDAHGRDQGGTALGHTLTPSDRGAVAQMPTKALPDRGGSAAEQGEDSEHAAVQVWGGLQAELAEQLGAGRFDGSFADTEFAGDA
jgi:hypothetical protein